MSMRFEVIAAAKTTENGQTKFDFSRVMVSKISAGTYAVVGEGNSANAGRTTFAVLITEEAGGRSAGGGIGGYFPDALYSRDANKSNVYVSNKDVVDVFSQSVQPVAGTVTTWGVAIYELVAGSASKIPNGAGAPILFIQITLQMEDWTRNSILRDYNAHGGGQGMIMNYRESIQDWNGYLHVARSTTLKDAVNGRNYGTYNQNYLPRK